MKRMRKEPKEVDLSIPRKIRDAPCKHVPSLHTRYAECPTNLHHEQQQINRTKVLKF